MSHPLRAALLGLLCLPTTSLAGPLRTPVLELLSGYEATATPADLAQLGDGVPAELMEIADDASVASSRRSRAITALQHYPTPDVRGFLEAHLDKADKGILRRKAAMSLGAGFGAAAVPVLAKHLADEDTLVRVAVVQSLGMTSSAEAREALQARLDVEPVESVKEAIGKALEVK